jgi:predicted regulator of Ras-like GTPase activity (Roadblock/LC7/MglB family)
VAVGASTPGSRAGEVRRILGEISTRQGVRGAVLVAPDGFVIESHLPGELAVEPLAALAAALGRELELGADRLSRGLVGTAFFSADDGSLFLGGGPVGFLAVVTDRGVDVQETRDTVKRTLDALQQVWRAGDHRGERL